MDKIKNVVNSVVADIRKKIGVVYAGKTHTGSVWKNDFDFRN